MEEERQKPEKKPLNEKLMPTGVNDKEPPKLVTRAAESLYSFWADEDCRSEDIIPIPQFSDLNLEEKILRQRFHVKEMGPKLPDGGINLKAFLRHLENQQEERRRPAAKEYEESKKPSKSRNKFEGPLDCSGQEHGSPKDHAQSSCWKGFYKPVDENSNSRRVNIKRSNAHVLPKLGKKRRVSQWPRVNCTVGSDVLRAEFYYPSSDDRNPILISYDDMGCLAPKTYLTSNIVDFYIRYLQQQATLNNRALDHYLFCNTFFYTKLKQVMTYEGTDKNGNFVKFRKWRNNVDIFQKAYIVIPIHEAEHWSLVIICIPDKDNNSSSIVLHLDSLKCHCSRTICRNIQSFLNEERNLSKQEGDTKLPITGDICKQHPHDETILMDTFCACKVYLPIIMFSYGA